MLESFFNPLFAMIVVDTAQRILSEEPTPADRPIENVEYLNFGGISDFTPGLSSHCNVS
jgi:hypothetical protein